MGWGCDRIEETLLIFNPATDPQMWNSPEVDVLRVAFQILKEQRVSTVRESWQFWGIESDRARTTQPWVFAKPHVPSGED